MRAAPASEAGAHAARALVLALAFCHTVCVGGQLPKTDSIHKTLAADKPINDLSCLRCHTMDQNDRCVDLRGGNGEFSVKCKDDKRVCMVKRISYTTSNENSTTLRKMWSLERNCTKHCEPGCIVIGERTKIYACTSCCNKHECNNGTGGATAQTRAADTVATIRIVGCLLVAMIFTDFTS